MIGAILGDIIGSPYEFDENNIKTKKFPLFVGKSTFTDDSVLTVAVAEALMDAREKGLFASQNRQDGDDDEIRDLVVKSLKKWGRKYPSAGYGARFIEWLDHGERPYNSLGNGSAMRASSVGWLYDDLDTTLRMAELSADVTHDHPEGIKGAQAVASAVYLARTGSTKDEIRKYITDEFGYR